MYRCQRCLKVLVVYQEFCDSCSRKNRKKKKQNRSNQQIKQQKKISFGRTEKGMKVIEHFLCAMEEVEKTLKLVEEVPILHQKLKGLLAQMKNFAYECNRYEVVSSDDMINEQMLTMSNTKKIHTHSFQRFGSPRSIHVSPCHDRAGKYRLGDGTLWDD
jgi:hypothetical protein